MVWYPFDNGENIGRSGSESGIIIRDDEHQDGARITIERDGHIAPFAITCGIYGWMFHTRFFGTEPEAQNEFERMRSALGTIMVMIPLAVDPEADDKSRLVAQSISEFVKRFPT